MATIYLAGPIDNIPRDEAHAWRDQASELLVAARHVAYNPLRCRRGPQGITWSDAERKSMVAQDLAAVATSDLILANLDKEKPTCGTYVEIGYAIALGKQIVIVRGAGGLPSFISGLVDAPIIGIYRECNVVIVDSLDKAIEWICDYLWSNKED